MINAYHSFIQHLFCSSIPTASNPTPQLNFFAVYSDAASLTGYQDSITVLSFPPFPSTQTLYLTTSSAHYLCLQLVITMIMESNIPYTYMPPLPPPSPAQHLLPHPTPPSFFPHPYLSPAYFMKTQEQCPPLTDSYTEGTGMLWGHSASSSNSDGINPLQDTCPVKVQCKWHHVLLFLLCNGYATYIQMSKLVLNGL